MLVADSDDLQPPCRPPRAPAANELEELTS
jgi:hypothetical protein